MANMIKMRSIDNAHNARNMCNMKNLTLRIDEKLLERARQVAMIQGKTVNSLIRDYLADYVEMNDRRKKARAEILRMCRESNAVIGEITWKREDLYDRR